LVSRFNLSKSFNYTPYLFSKKVEKTITSLLSAGSVTSRRAFLFLQQMAIKLIPCSAIGVILFSSKTWRKKITYCQARHDTFIYTNLAVATSRHGFIAAKRIAAVCSSIPSQPF
jgi:hypothetical protein